LLPWADDVAAVLLAWFPGQEFGDALADVLVGRVEPGGRLPTTWPLSEVGHPSVTPVDGTLRYDESLFVGYRAYDRDNHTPRYPFGHGLGYTAWAYEEVSSPANVPAGEDVTVRVIVGNAGSRAGRDVVQVYASRPDSAVERPVQWLAGFAPVELASGESAAVDVVIAARAFQHWDTAARQWMTEPGMFRLDVGRSSRDLLLSAEITVGSQ
jgi:beta-glucosidase